ncbi:hypothetical protein GLP37_17775 [Photobacterium phosphoreum]|uniref:helix-turn-helix domain-containing protein n=1 Tax=Photobacterium phosphoreum TaxID=659 RepID=UPI001E4C5388|nr:helix-turn-helix transcriptional regulator [Photobacterium phosphoreum]MCD9504022.1 hypothetical protein [Photobacterium phosphoreum]
MNTINTIDLASKINHSLPEKLSIIFNCLFPELSDKEIECLFWICNGHSYSIAADKMGITERTIKFHSSNCMKKLTAYNNYDLRMIYHSRLLAYLLLK